MHHLEVPKAIFFFFFDTGEAGEILGRGRRSTVSEAFKGEARHVMKPANQKQLAGAGTTEKTGSLSAAALIQL